MARLLQNAVQPSHIYLSYLRSFLIELAILTLKPASRSSVSLPFVMEAKLVLFLSVLGLGLSVAVGERRC